MKIWTNKALDEIYILLHRSDLNISKEIVKFLAFFTFFLQKFVFLISLIFAQILMNFYRNFADNLENVEFV